LDHSPVFRDWKLPAIFAQLRQLLEERHGSLAGSRQFTRVLERLASDPAERIAEAIQWTLARDGSQVDLILSRVDRLREQAAPCAAASAENACARVPVVHVPQPDLSRFDRFLSSGDDEDVSSTTPAIEKQLETVATADDSCGV
jgi:hypothetical protein